MKTITLKEWKVKGEKLFGPDYKEWKFVCPACKGVQSYKDFDGVADDPENYFFFSCIGRFKENVGCDWTLGGLLQIHKTEVIDEEGKAHPVFEFAETESSNT
jgi:hypothetical protein